MDSAMCLKLPDVTYLQDVTYVFCDFVCGLDSVQLIQVGEMFGGFAHCRMGPFNVT